MRYLILFVALCLVVPVDAGDGKIQRIEVTGNVALPPESKAPAKFRVAVKIRKLKPAKPITLLQPVGRAQIETVQSFPVSYTVACPRSALKDTPPELFILRASVYEYPAKGGLRLVYKTPDNDRTEALSANGEGRKDVRLTVAPVSGK